DRRWCGRDRRGRLRRGAERHVERVEAAERQAVPKVRGLTRELDLSEALDESAEDYLRLCPRERRPKTIAHAPAGGEGVEGRATHVQPIRVGKAGRIVISRAEEWHHRLPRGDRDAADLDRSESEPDRELRRAVVAEELVGKAGEERRIGAEQRELIR